MKKLAYSLSVLMLFVSLVPSAMAKEDGPEPNKKELSPEDQARLDQLENRFLEIKAMDFNSMEKSERKEVRKELRDINKESKGLGGGVYISTGAIIIILLLILIL
ncbi:hypothetical protein Q4534_15505 [Cyclobacterium sp. 1_MG-2023]|uniref:hypothetical protein n=1 Tax=Cyclobacterium sp. 1_MG-2023 TaxID=3062681 RepID=UPI0026E48C19|nr:hypothetical protein [Cyclobacterium sp. 1_MG-2023]MDO6438830.1 hypothetical protein [Cyclobacterium sp. 1_MG-2023]